MHASDGLDAGPLSISLTGTAACVHRRESFSSRASSRRSTSSCDGATGASHLPGGECRSRRGSSSQGGSGTGTLEKVRGKLESPTAANKPQGPPCGTPTSTTTGQQRHQGPCQPLSPSRRTTAEQASTRPSPYNSPVKQASIGHARNSSCSSSSSPPGRLRGSPLVPASNKPISALPFKERRRLETYALNAILARADAAMVAAMVLRGGMTETPRVHAGAGEAGASHAV